LLFSKDREDLGKLEDWEDRENREDLGKLEDWEYCENREDLGKRADWEGRENRVDVAKLEGGECGLEPREYLCIFSTEVCFQIF